MSEQHSMPGDLAGDLAMALPDIPRWIETRSMLLSGQGEVLGLDETNQLSFVVRCSEGELVSVVGLPEAEAIREAVSRNENKGAVLAPPENTPYVARALPDWKNSPAVIHLLYDNAKLPLAPEKMVRGIEAFEIDVIGDLPPDLKKELETAAKCSLVVAAFIEDRPVSFCYVAAETETLWDISIDTLAEYRQHGYAALCVAYLVDYMRKLGKQPVWGAEVANVASMRLAAKLGFVPVDNLSVFYPKTI